MSSACPNATPDHRGDGRAGLGVRGEQAVAEHYAARAHRVVARNWRCRYGEIDLVLEGPGGVGVFCEVKTRRSDRYGSPFEAVTAAKQRRLRRLAGLFLAEPRTPAWRPASLRFDVAAVTVGRDGVLQVEMLPSAF